MGVALTTPDGLWDAERYPDTLPLHRVVSVWRVLVLCAGLVATAAAMAAAWVALAPATLVQMRIVADGSGPAARAALAHAAVGIGTGPSQSAVLERQGDALLLTVADEHEPAAWQRARSLADTLLNLPVPPGPAPLRPRDTPAPGTRAALLLDRDRLLASADAADSRAASASASLSAVTRDLAAGTRAAADRRVGRDTLDKAAGALADLQLQRIQLATRYQDDYPAVVAMDGQIRSLRSFLQDETRRVDAAARSGVDAADTILAGERDRLRTELYQANERRVTIAAELASVARILAATPPGAVSAPQPEAYAGPPAPVLIEAASTVATGPDNRLQTVPAIAATGLLLTLLAWFRQRPHPATAQAELLLNRLEAVRYALLANEAGEGAALQPARGPSSSLLTRVARGIAILAWCPGRVSRLWTPAGYARAAMTASRASAK